MEHLYKIAGVKVRMNCSGRTEIQALPYIIENSETNESDFTVEPDWTLKEVHYPNISEEMFEYIDIGRCFYKKMLRYDGLMLHASAVIMDGKAYLFTATSGTGKSTHTALWRRVFGDERARILNDDKPLLRLEDGVWYAYGTPWSGKTDLNLNLRVPVGGICVLERGENNFIEPFKGKMAISKIFYQIPRPKETELRDKVLELLDDLLSNVPIWHLKCNMEPDAAILSYETMSGIRKVEYNEN